MTAPDRDPLTPEERALAQRLQRLGGPGGPSAATDARILAAARAAVAPEHPSRAHSRRRRPAWWRGGAVSAIGTAAAFVIAIGTAWQLRPVDRPPAHTSTRFDDGVVEVELLGPRDDRARPFDATGPGALSTEGNPARRPVGAEKGRPAPEPGDPAEAAPARASRLASPASEPATSAAAASLQRRSATATPEAPEAAAVAPATPEPAAAPTPDAAPPAPPAGAGAPGQDAQPRARGDRPQRATYTTAARARAESQHDRASAPTTKRTREAPSIDLATVPVDVDARLVPAAWLERIRARRDAGDADGARASLRRFEQAHPRLRLPRDLRELRDSAP